MQEEDDEEDKTEDAHQEPQHHHPMHPLMHMYALAMGKLSLLLQGSAPKMKQCVRAALNVMECFTQALGHLKQFLAWDNL